MHRKKAFIHSKQFDCPSPTVRPKYLGEIIASLGAVFTEIDPQFMEWFGPGLEQGPFEKITLNKCCSEAKLSHRQAIEAMTVKPSLMQILIASLHYGRSLEAGEKILAYPSDRYKNQQCLVTMINDNGTRKLKIAIPKENKTAPIGTRYIVAWTPTSGQDSVSFPKAVPAKPAPKNGMLLKAEVLA